MNIADICRVLAILYICWVYPSNLVGVSLWWTHSVYGATFCSTFGS